MSRILQADLGQSILNKRDVSEMIGQKLPVTIELGVTAFLITYCWHTAGHHRRAQPQQGSRLGHHGDRPVGGLDACLLARLVLMYVFSVNLRVFPATGSGGYST